MKKIECQISDEKSQQIEQICNKEGYTYAEFNRRALEYYLLSFQNDEKRIFLHKKES